MPACPRCGPKPTRCGGGVSGAWRRLRGRPQHLLLALRLALQAANEPPAVGGLGIGAAPQRREEPAVRCGRCAGVRACVRACMRACVRACVHGWVGTLDPGPLAGQPRAREPKAMGRARTYVLIREGARTVLTVRLRRATHGGRPHGAVFMAMRHTPGHAPHLSEQSTRKGRLPPCCVLACEPGMLLHCPPPLDAWRRCMLESIGWSWKRYANLIFSHLECGVVWRRHTAAG